MGRPHGAPNTANTVSEHIAKVSNTPKNIRIPLNTLRKPFEYPSNTHAYPPCKNLTQHSIQMCVHTEQNCFGLCGWGGDPGGPCGCDRRPGDVADRIFQHRHSVKIKVLPGALMEHTLWSYTLRRQALLLFSLASILKLRTYGLLGPAGGGGVPAPRRTSHGHAHAHACSTLPVAAGPPPLLGLGVGRIGNGGGAGRNGWGWANVYYHS